MCDDETLARLRRTPKITRRSFAVITASAAAMAGTVAYGQAKVVEKDVTVKTADGVSDSALFYPEGRGSWPAVLIWPDIMGLRPVFREMGRRLASQGYVVLVANPFYRSAKAADTKGGSSGDAAKTAPPARNDLRFINEIILDALPCSC